MSYVNLDDYAISISSEELSDILTQAATGYSLDEDGVRELHEARAQSKIKNFLGAKFNLAPEFIKTGTARNTELVSVYINLALCSLFRTVSPDDIPEMRDDLCEEAIQTLSDWRDGKTDLDGVEERVDAVGGPEFITSIKFISKPDSDPLVTTPEIESLSAPTNLTLDSAPAEISWTSTSNNEESGFQVDRGIDNINFLPIALTPTGTLEYKDTGVIGTPGTYYYRVRASGNSEKKESDFSDTLTVVVV